MATLGEDWLIQQISDEVVLFHRHTEVEVIRYNVRDRGAMAMAQGTIAADDRLNMEEKAFAHFWCGYFYAHATK